MHAVSGITLSYAVVLVIPGQNSVPAWLDPSLHQLSMMLYLLLGQQAALHQFL